MLDERAKRLAERLKHVEDGEIARLIRVDRDER